MTVYLALDETKAINAHFQGTPTIRDEPGLVAALARPLSVAYYQQADLAEQAAVLIDGIAQAHAFIDANKRTATAAGLVFLRLNGYVIRYNQDPQQDELGQQILALVIHQINVAQFAQWLRDHLAPLP